jgi:hypothetical protein
MRMRLICATAAAVLAVFGFAGSAWADPEDPNLGVSCETISDTGLANSTAHTGHCGEPDPGPDVPPDPGGDG